MKLEDGMCVEKGEKREENRPRERKRDWKRGSGELYDSERHRQSKHTYYVHTYIKSYIHVRLDGNLVEVTGL